MQTRASFFFRKGPGQQTRLSEAALASGPQCPAAGREIGRRAGERDVCTPRAETARLVKRDGSLFGCLGDLPGGSCCSRLCSPNNGKWREGRDGPAFHFHGQSAWRTVLWPPVFLRGWHLLKRNMRALSMACDWSVLAEG